MTETETIADTEPRPLQDVQVEAVRAEAEFRQKRDLLIATWRDWLHNYLKLTYSSPKIIHDVIDSMDDFLNHRSRK